MRLIILFFALAMTTAASAADFDDIARTIATNNPTVRARIETTEAEILSEKADNLLPAPEIEVEHLFAGKGVKDKTGVSLTQGFDWPGAYRARAKAMDSRNRALHLTKISEVADIALEAKITMLEIVYLKKRLALTDSILSNITRILADTEKGFAMGIFTRLDINRIKIEKLEMSARQNAILLRMDELESSLVNLNAGRPVNELISTLDAYPIETLEPLDNYLDKILQFDPALAAAKASAEATREEKSAARMSRLPGWSIGYKYTREEGHSFNGFSIGISLPFLSRNYAVRSADASLLASQYEYDATLIRLNTAAAALHSEAARLAAIAAEYAEVFEKSDNIRLLYKAYQGRQMSSVEYLNDINYFLNGYEAYLENSFNYAVALAKLNRIHLLSGLSEMF